MKKINNYIIPFLFTFIMCITTISHPAAVDYVTGTALDIILYTDGTYSVDGGNTTTDEVYFYNANGKPDYSTYLYFKGGEAITYQYLLDNPDFSITFNLVSPSSENGNSSIAIGYSDTHKRFFHKNLSIYGTTSFTLNSQSKMQKTGTVQDYVLSEFFSDSANSEQAEKMLQSPILVYSNDQSDIWTLNTTGVTTGGTIDTGTDDETGTGGVTDGTEEDNTGILNGIKEFFSNIFDDIKAFFSNLFDNLKTFFTGMFDDIKNWFSEQFAPLLEMFDIMKQRDEASESFDTGLVGSLSSLIEKLESVTLDPVTNMFDNIKSGTLGVLQSIYEFPMIKELIVASTAITIFSAIMMLLTTF